MRRISKHTFLIALVVVVAAVVRFWRLPSLPAWYTDEGWYLSTGWNLVHGQWTTFGIRDWTFASPFVTTPPLGQALAGFLALLFGKSIVPFRFLTATVGVATVMSLWFIGRRVYRSPWAGLLAAAAYAFVPVIVVNNRWSFPHNLTGLLLLWSFYLLWRAHEGAARKFALFGVACAAGASLISFWVWGFVVVILGLFWRQGWRRALQLAALAAAPAALALTLRAVTVPHAFFFDLGAMLSGVSIINSDHGTPIWFSLLFGFYSYFHLSVFFLLALGGLILARPRGLRLALAAAVLFTALPVLINRADYGGYFYSALSFTPLLILGIGGLVWPVDALTGLVRRYVGLTIGVALAAVSIFYLVQVGNGIASGRLADLAGREEFIREAAVPQMQAVAEYLNPRLQPDDFVIAPNNLNWQLRAFTVDILWVACYQQRARFPNLWTGRFVRPMNLANARYLVDDTLFGGDAGVCREFQPAVEAQFESEHWPLVFSAGRFRVYQNPAPKSALSE